MIEETIRNMFLLGVGAVAETADKSKELIDRLVAKGELTVEQGKDLNEGLKHKVANSAADVNGDLLSAYIDSMDREGREKFFERIESIKAEHDCADVDADEAEIEISDSDK